MGPKSIQHEAKIGKDAFRGAKRHQKKLKSSFYQCDPSLLDKFWVLSGAPKLTKIVPRAENVRSEMASDAISIVFGCCCRSESLSGSIFGGLDPSKSCSRLSGSTILTTSPFSEKHRTTSRQGPLLVPQMAQNRRRGDQELEKMVKKYKFRGPNF